MRGFWSGLVIVVVGLGLGSSVAPAKGLKGDAQKSQPAGSKQNPRGKAIASPPPTRIGAVVSPPAGSDFRIGPGDVLVVNVWKEPEITQTETVRPDGKISLPLIGDLEASGLTPKQLESEVTQKLQSYLDAPQVTIIVHEVKSQRVNVVGQVAKPGSYALFKPMTVLDAIATAGGLLEYAKAKKIYVLRAGPDGRTKRLPFNYKAVLKGQNPAQNTELESRDTVVVP